MQDGDHGYRTVAAELRLFKNMPNLKCVWAHDYHLPGRGIKLAWDELGDSFCKTWTAFNEQAYQAGFVIAKI